MLSSAVEGIDKAEVRSPLTSTACVTEDCVTGWEKSYQEADDLSVPPIRASDDH
jgi:hypothetical protein